MNQAQIKVVHGSCEGQIVPIIPGEVVSIGRSRHSNNRIVASELDVSARHCMVRMDDDGSLWLEVLSDKVTELDGQALKSGDRIPLKCGQEIRLGNSVSFVLDSPDDDMPTTSAPSAIGSDDDLPTTMVHSAAGSGDDMPTSALFAPPRGGSASAASGDKPASGAEPDESQNKTATEFETRYASYDELEKVKRKYQFKRQMRAVSLGFAVLLFLGMSCASYFMLRTKPEKRLVWPTNLKDPKAKTSAILRDRIGLVFPSTYRCDTSKTDVVDVQTTFGTKRDVPVHIHAEAWDDPEGLQIDRITALNRYMKKMQREDSTVRFPYAKRNENVAAGENEYDLHPFFINKGVSESPGVPLNLVSISRKIGNKDYFGYLIYFRYRDMNISYIVEAPESMKDKTEKGLLEKLGTMFQVGTPLTVLHWEGTSNYRKDTSIDQDLEDARFEMAGPPDSLHRAYRYILGALIKSRLANDENSLTRATNELGNLRKRQAKFFSDQWAAYRIATDEKDSNQKEKIREECKNIFRDPDTDYRHDPF